MVGHAAPTAGEQPVTTIHGDGGTVVTCDRGEGADTVLDGFAITGGSADFGGGLYTRASFATEDSMSR